MQDQELESCEAICPIPRVQLPPIFFSSSRRLSFWELKVLLLLFFCLLALVIACFSPFVVDRTRATSKITIINKCRQAAFAF